MVSNRHFAAFLEQRVDNTFENLQKSCTEIVEYLIGIDAPSIYSRAINDFRIVMEGVQQYIWKFIEESSSEESNQQSIEEIESPASTTVPRVQKKKKKLPKSNKTKIISKSKSLSKKMRAIDNTQTLSNSELEAIDSTKFEISVLNQSTENNKNVRRSGRVKYPPINRFAGEKLVQLQDGSFAVIKSKRSLMPKLVLLNKRDLAQLKKNKSRQKRLQAKKKSSKNSKKQSAKVPKVNCSPKRTGKRTLYSPTKWLDSLNNNSELYMNDSKNSNQ